MKKMKKPENYPNYGREEDKNKVLEYYIYGDGILMNAPENKGNRYFSNYWNNVSKTWKVLKFKCTWYEFDKIVDEHFDMCDTKIKVRDFGLLSEMEYNLRPIGA